MMTELESMVVRLVGDSSAYERMLQAAQVATVQVVTVIESATKRIEEFATNITGWAGKAEKALSGLGAKKFLEDAFAGFADKEVAALRLGAAIEGNGREAKAAQERYKEFAAEMWDTVGASKGQTSELLTMAEGFGMWGATAEKAVKNALGLAALLKGSPANYLRVTEALESNNAKMLYRIPLLRGIKGEEEKLQKAQELVDRGWKVAGEMVKGVDGTLAVFQATIKGLTKQYGELVAEAIKPALDWFTELITPLTKLDVEYKKWIVNSAFLVSGLLAIRPTLLALTTAVKPFMAVISTFLTPLGLVVAGLSIALLQWVNSVGGLGKAFELIKGKAEVAWEWIAPVRSALKGLWDSIVGQALYTWGLIKASAVVAWDWIQGKVEVDWALVLSTITRVIRTAEMIVRNFGDITDAVWAQVIQGWGLIGESVDVVVGSVNDLIDATVGWATDFVKENYQAIGTIVALVAGILVGIGVFKGLIAVVGVTQFVVSALHLQWFAGIALAVAWGAAVLVAKSAILAYGAGLAIVNGVIWLWNMAKSAAIAVAAASAIATATETAAEVANTTTTVAATSATAGFSIAKLVMAAASGVATIATWGLNAAITALMLLLSPVAIIAGSIALVALTAAAVGAFAVFTVGYATVMGVHAALWAVVDVLSALPTSSGPIATVTGMFGQWWTILKAVWKAVAVDSKLAWEVLTVGAKLALAQIKDLWPPLWEFIRSGFHTIWEVAVGEFDRRFRQIVMNMIIWASEKFVGMVESIPGHRLFLGVAGNTALDLVKTQLAAVKALQDDYNKSVETASAEAIADGKKRIMEAANAFKNVEGKEAEALRKQMDELLKKVADLPDEFKVDPKSLDAAKKAGEQLGSQFNKGADKELKKLEATLWGSAEALSRINAYYNRLADWNTKQVERDAATEKARLDRQKAQAAVPQAVQDIAQNIIPQAGIEAPGIPLPRIPNVPAQAPQHGPGVEVEVGGVANVIAGMAAEAQRAGEIAEQAAHLAIKAQNEANAALFDADVAIADQAVIAAQDAQRMAQVARGQEAEKVATLVIKNLPNIDFPLDVIANIMGAIQPAEARGGINAAQAAQRNPALAIPPEAFNPPQLPLIPNPRPALAGQQIQPQAPLIPPGQGVVEELLKRIAIAVEKDLNRPVVELDPLDFDA